MEHNRWRRELKQENVLPRSLHEQSFCCPPDGPAWQQTAQSHKLLHLYWNHSITQTTLPSPPHDRLADRIKTGFGFDIEPTVENHDAGPCWSLKKQAFGHLGAIFSSCSWNSDLHIHQPIGKFAGFREKQILIFCCQFAADSQTLHSQARSVHSAPRPLFLHKTRALLLFFANWHQCSQLDTTYTAV